MHKLLVCVKESDGLLWRELESTKSARAFPSINFVRCTCSTTARDRLRQVGGVQKRGCLTFDNMQAKFASPPFQCICGKLDRHVAVCFFTHDWCLINPADRSRWVALIIGAWCVVVGCVRSCRSCRAHALLCWCLRHIVSELNQPKLLARPAGNCKRSHSGRGGV